MPNHSLLRRCIPMPLNLCAINNPPHLAPLLLIQLHVPTPPILYQSPLLGRPRNRNEALTRDPRERHLRDAASLALRQFLDLLDDGFVCVEVCSLEFRDCWGRGEWKDSELGARETYRSGGNRRLRSRRASCTGSRRRASRVRADCTPRTQRPVLARYRSIRRFRAGFQRRSTRLALRRSSRLYFMSACFPVSHQVCTNSDSPSAASRHCTR
jgi:hypothetical protein